MALILIETTTPNGIIDSVGTGTLWGISLGTTTKASTYSDYVLIDCTKTRAINLCNAAPEDMDIPILDNEPDSFTETTHMGKVWYLRGLIV